MEIESLEIDDGLEVVDNSKGIALIDADTLAYTTCLQEEYGEELLPRDFYTDEEWEELVNTPGYYEAEDGSHWIYSTDLDKILAEAKDKIRQIQHATNTKSVEIYFSSGRTFRHDLADRYKANRLKMRYPEGLEWLKNELIKHFPGAVCDGFEADDMVVMLKRRNPEKYILCAVDKDVLNSVPGKHWNYYISHKYGIDPKWVEIDATHATRWAYIQALMGDTSDNIDGIRGVGKKTAEKILGEAYLPCDLWKAVKRAYLKHKLTVKHAIETIRLVHMHQLQPDLKINLWEPPC